MRDWCQGALESHITHSIHIEDIIGDRGGRERGEKGDADAAPLKGGLVNVSTETMQPHRACVDYIMKKGSRTLDCLDIRLNVSKCVLLGPQGAEQVCLTANKNKYYSYIEKYL